MKSPEQAADEIRAVVEKLRDLDADKARAFDKLQEIADELVEEEDEPRSKSKSKELKVKEKTEEPPKFKVEPARK